MSRDTQGWKDAYGIDIPQEGHCAIGCGKFVVDVPLASVDCEDLGQRLWNGLRSLYRNLMRPSWSRTSWR